MLATYDEKKQNQSFKIAWNYIHNWNRKAKLKSFACYDFPV